MPEYKVLKKQVFSNGEYSLVPIRYEDRYKIMQWRNEQIYHLRQREILTPEKQNHYFDNVVSKLFNSEKPDQILFSFLKNEECIGYGGLVHIDWDNLNAEISFIMNTKLEKDHFAEYWSEYLNIIEVVGFCELKLNKLYVYSFDLRPHLYVILANSNYFLDATLRSHIYYQNKFIDVIIYSKLKLL